MKTVHILHTAFHHCSGETGAPLAKRSFNCLKTDVSDEDILESIFSITNGRSIDDCIVKEIYKTGHVYSSSVGDVITIRHGPYPEDINHYIITSIGFKPLTSIMFNALLYQYQNDKTLDPRGFWESVAR